MDQLLHSQAEMRGGSGQSEACHHLTKARVGVLRGGSLPSPVPVISQASLTVVSSSSVLTQADAAAGWVRGVFRNTDIGVSVTLTPPSHLQVSNPVVIRFQHLGIHEDLVSESVQSDENNPGGGEAL